MLSQSMFWIGKALNELTSSFSRTSAIVLNILSEFRFTHSCRMIKLPLVSSRRRSVLKSSSNLTKKLANQLSSELAEICANNCKSCLITYEKNIIDDRSAIGATHTSNVTDLFRRVGKCLKQSREGSIVSRK